MTPAKEAAPRAANLEGWAELRPEGGRFYSWYSSARTDKRWPRVQHYFFGGRSLCGKRSLDEKGVAAPELYLELERRPGVHSLPSGAKPAPPPAGRPCARCVAREATYLFRRRRHRRLIGRDP